MATQTRQQEHGQPCPPRILNVDGYIALVRPIIADLPDRKTLLIKLVQAFADAFVAEAAKHG